MNEHSMRVLEFDKIKEEIDGYAFLDRTRNKIEKIMPFRDINIIKRELELVREMSELKRFDGGIELDMLKETEELLKKSEIVGFFLDPAELYDIKTNMKIFRRVKGKIAEYQAKYKNLHFYIKDAPIYNGIEDLIEKVIDDEKKIKDDASLEIKEIRNNKKAINETIKRKFDEIINNPDNAKALQEKILTMRDGRFVIPVKADFKGYIKGIEHDRSASGVTVFIEPLAVVSLNNKVRELEVKEREEIRKILLRLTDVIRSNLEGIREMEEMAGEVDFINSKAEYSIANKCNVPKINEKEYIKLDKARHPLISPAKMVPVSLEIGRKNNIMLITGPNTGGKTVTLKTTGLITLMALSGIPVPAEETSDIGVFSGVYADIGDEQSIEQNLSSFSGHLKSIKEILDGVTRNSLILLDELGSGTDPVEGAALAIAIVEHLKNKKAKVIITTHYSEVKAYGYNEEGIESASMEFDVNTLSPTYKLLIGIPGKSNALTIARKLGVNEEVINAAEARISKENKEVESMISEIKEKSDEIDKRIEANEKKEEDITKLKIEYENKLKEIERDKNRIIAEAYAKADEVVKNMQSKAKALIDKIQKEDAQKEDAKEAQKSINMLRKALEEEKVVVVKKEEKRDIKPINFKVGDKIFIRSMNCEGVVLKLMQDRGEAQIQAGVLKLNVSYEDLEKVEKKEKTLYRAANVSRKSVKNELDVRGKNVDEAIQDIDIYLDSATMTGFKEIFIIHGKGTGKLREGIQEYLDDCRYIKGYRDGNFNEGGMGVTAVMLKD